MSHFTVTVRLTAERLARHDGKIHDAVAELLAPFEESPEEESGKKYLEFKDEEDRYRNDYATGTIDRVRTPDGELLKPYDERFRVSGFGIGSDTHKVPDDCQLVQIPFREAYATFDQFAKEYHGVERDSATGRYGYRHNPNAKWDWWIIGGRWTGYFPLKSDRAPRLGRPGVFANEADPGHGDIVHVDDIDLDRVAEQARVEAAEFWEKWSLFLKTHDDNEHCLRRRGISLGLLTVVQGPASPTDGVLIIPWTAYQINDSRREWNDVVTLIDR